MTIDSPQHRLDALFRKVGLARAGDLEAAGISRTQIRRLVDQGTLEKVGRGLYRSAEASPTEKSDLVQAARLVPSGVICLLSALRFHGLTTQNPFEVWIAIGSKAWRPKVEHPPLRVIHMSEESLTTGVEKHLLEGVPVHVFSAAKSVVDCFKFRNKVGIDAAVEALRDYRHRHPKRMEAVWRFAEAARVARVMRPYLEAMG